MLCMQHNCQCHTHVTITFVHGWSHQATSKLVSARVGYHTVLVENAPHFTPLPGWPLMTSLMISLWWPALSFRTKVLTRNVFPQILNVYIYPLLSPTFSRSGVLSVMTFFTSETGLMSGSLMTKSCVEFTVLSCMYVQIRLTSRGRVHLTPGGNDYCMLSINDIQHMSLVPQAKSATCKASCFALPEWF